jgi:hypothetical protein
MTSKFEEVKIKEKLGWMLSWVEVSPKSAAKVLLNGLDITFDYNILPNLKSFCKMDLDIHKMKDSMEKSNTLNELLDPEIDRIMRGFLKPNSRGHSEFVVSIPANNESFSWE